MKNQTASEIITAVFFSLAASGGDAFTQHAGSVIDDAIDSGLITDPAAKKFLARLARIARHPEPA
jgi:hypothetical protein